MLSKIYAGWRYLGLYPLLSLLPARIGYRLAGLGYRYDPFLSTPTQRAVSNGLARAFPDVSPAQRKIWVEEYQAMMGRELLDIYRLCRAEPHRPLSWVDVHGAEALLKAKDSGVGCVLAMAHFGRPSVLFAALSTLGVTLNVVTMSIRQDNTELDGVTRRYLRFKIGTNMRFLRGRWHPIDQSPRSLYASLRQGETVAILFDVRARPSDKCLDIPFLHDTIRVPVGFARLAQHGAAQVFYGRASDVFDRVSIEIIPIGQATDVETSVRACVRQLENDVRRWPWQWWQWNIYDYLLAGTL